MEEAYQFQGQQLVFGGGGNASSAVDEAYINGVCAGLSYRSLLTYGVHDPTAVETTPDLLKMPKTEEFFDCGSGVAAPPYTFFSDAASSSSVVVDHQLPDLLSLELPPHNSSTSSTAVVARVPHGGQRRRRPAQRLSDKTRCLQKLLPVDARMDMATVLEEAYKYIKFLQAQISVLQSMPCDGGGGASAAAYGVGGGDLGRLNRQELLQVVVNSPVAQTQLYSHGCCLYSVEQLVLLKQKAERKALQHQMMMMLGSGNANSFLA